MIGMVTAIIAGGLLLSMLAALALRAWRSSIEDPTRLVAELRLVQVGAMVLCLTSGTVAGMALLHLDHAGSGLQVALAMLFLVVACAATWREPGDGLLIIAIAFAVHAVFDTLHRPGWLGDALVPRTVALGLALFHVTAALVCAAPLLRRR